MSAEAGGGPGPGGRLEIVADDSWQEFLSAPASVLMLATTTCPICKKWTAELSEWLETDEAWRHVRFGKLNLNTDDVAEFKKANREWLTEVPGVPFSVFFVNGEPQGNLPGRGVKRLVRRLEKLLAPSTD